MILASRVAVASLAACAAFAAQAANAKTFNIRIASGHPPAVVYAGLMKNFFQTELKKAVESRTEHKINFVEGYSGSIVKVYETLEGVQNGIVDIGGFCYCFEASKLKMHAFQVMLPFGTMDPVMSVNIARDVYDKHPILAATFPKYGQKLLAIIGDGGYNLGTNFDWSKVSDLKNIKIVGAGLNLNWLRYAGVTPVQGSLPEWYTGLKTGLYKGGIMFPSAWRGFKLWEVGKYYTMIGFGSITWHGLTANNRFWKNLPKDVQDIMLEVARKFETKTGSNNKERYDGDVEWLRKNITVKVLPADVRLDWARSLKDWPQAHANTLEKEGLPAVDVLNTTLESAEKHGYKWPVRYVVKKQ